MTNNSGIKPVDLKVLFLPDAVETHVGSIELPPEVIEQRKWKRQRGVIVAKGRSTFAEWLDKPNVGDRVVIAPNSGSKFFAEDKTEYWIINDEDIIAVEDVH